MPGTTTRVVSVTKVVVCALVLIAALLDVADGNSAQQLLQAVEELVRLVIFGVVIAIVVKGEVHRCTLIHCALPEKNLVHSLVIENRADSRLDLDRKFVYSPHPQAPGLDGAVDQGVVDVAVLARGVIWVHCIPHHLREHDVGDLRENARRSPRGIGQADAD
eukprot:766259-Hanusia_phi.AAC.2